MARAAAAAGGEIGSSDEASFADLRSRSALDKHGGAAATAAGQAAGASDAAGRSLPHRAASGRRSDRAGDLAGGGLDAARGPGSDRPTVRPVVLAVSRVNESTAASSGCCAPMTAERAGRPAGRGAGARGVRSHAAAAGGGTGHGGSRTSDGSGAPGSGPDARWAAGAAVLRRAADRHGSAGGPVCLAQGLAAAGVGNEQRARSVYATALGFEPLLRTTVWVRSGSRRPDRSPRTGD